MPEEDIIFNQNSEEVQEIITAIPSWIVRRGITVIFTLIISIVVLSAFIQYPDVVKTTLKINSLNAPKAVFTKQAGKVTKLLIKDKTRVKQNQALAFIESTANHSDVLELRTFLTRNNNLIEQRGIIAGNMPTGLNLGELQGDFQNFYQEYLQYLSTQNDGYYINRKKYLQQDLREINKLKLQILVQQRTQEAEYANMEEEYVAYKKLYQKGVISKNEFKQQENKYLASKYPLQQSQTAILNNNSSYSSKQKEILELDHTIREEKAKFVQALNNLLSATDAWLKKYVIFAPVEGIASYAGILQENQTVTAEQEIFILNPGNTDFFGEVQIPQYNMGKIRTGQVTLIKLRSYPFEQYGMIRGRINYISDAAYRDSVFIAKIDFELFENKVPAHKIVLKNGMQADVDIVTEESSLLQRFLRNITKMMNNN